MLGLPQSTEVNKFVAKQKFFDRADLSPAVRQAFTDDIEKIVWANKIAPKTMNVSAGGDIEELEIFHIRLKRRDFNPKILEAIDKTIPYTIVYVMEYGGLRQVWAAYKEKSANNKTAVVRYFHGGWTEDPVLPITGGRTDAIYAGILESLSATLSKTEETDLKTRVVKSVKIDDLKRQIDVLTKKMAAEKQFNRQCEIRTQIKKIKTQIQSLEKVDNGQNESF